MDYREYNDYELLSYIAEKNEEATEIMYKKYEPLITSIANKMFKYTKGTGLDVNDLIQEGMLGLSKAIDNYNFDVEVSNNGQVLEVGDGIARVYGLTSAMSSELVEFQDGNNTKRLMELLKKDGLI